MKTTNQDTVFDILPVIRVTKHVNPLSEHAKIDFDSDWNYVISIEFGWLTFGTGYYKCFKNK